MRRKSIIFYFYPAFAGHGAIETRQRFIMAVRDYLLCKKKYGKFLGCQLVLFKNYGLDRFIDNFLSSYLNNETFLVIDAGDDSVYEISNLLKLIKSQNSKKKIIIYVYTSDFHRIKLYSIFKSLVEGDKTLKNNILYFDIIPLKTRSYLGSRTTLYNILGYLHLLLFKFGWYSLYHKISKSVPSPSFSYKED